MEPGVSARGKERSGLLDRERESIGQRVGRFGS